MKLIIASVLIILSLALAVQSFFFFKETGRLKAEAGNFFSKLKSLERENEKLKAEIDFFSKPENLEKELKTKFNYRRPDEKLMIIVP